MIEYIKALKHLIDMDNETYYDKLTKKIKDNPTGAKILLIFVVSSSLLTFLKDIKETYKDLGFDTQKVEYADSIATVLEPSISAVVDSTSTIFADKKSSPESKIDTDTIVNYTVKPYENLAIIAEKFNLTTSILLEINPSLKSNSEITNSEIKIKVRAIHYVGPGDVLRVLAEKYNINKESIMKANGKSKDIVKRGEGLYIPVTYG